MNKPNFASKQHETFFFNALKKSGRTDSYHAALFYTLGICEDTRRNIGSLFDFAQDMIRPEALEQGWQTSGSLRLCRLAFNLWNGFTEEGRDACMETPYELFDCSYAPYMMEGIKLRYPEYCRELRPAARTDPGAER